MPAVGYRCELVSIFESTCLLLHVALSPNLEVGFIKTCPVEAWSGHKLKKRYFYLETICGNVQTRCL